jgi:hypothetical protein
LFVVLLEVVDWGGGEKSDWGSRFAGDFIKGKCVRTLEVKNVGERVDV